MKMRFMLNESNIRERHNNIQYNAFNLKAESIKLIKSLFLQSLYHARLLKIKKRRFFQSFFKAFSNLLIHSQITSITVPHKKRL